jgi:uroporphyrinogen III methyltransferase/synthase
MSPSLRLASPLAGWRVAVTRPTPSAGPLVAALERLGADPFMAPVIRIVPPEDRAPLVAAIAAIGTYDWVVFTSANAVRAVGPLLGRRTWRPRSAAPRIAAVGPATAGALEQQGIPVDFVPPRFDGATVGEMLDLRPGQRVLLPRSAIGSAMLPDALRARGARVDSIVAYGVAPGAGAAPLEAALAVGALDCLTFFSPSAVRAFATLSIGSADSLPPIVTVGPVTGAAAEAVGLPVAAVAERHDDEGVVARLVELALVHPRGGSRARY